MSEDRDRLVAEVIVEVGVEQRLADRLREMYRSHKGMYEFEEFADEHAAFLVDPSLFDAAREQGAAEERERVIRAVFLLAGRHDCAELSEGNLRDVLASLDAALVSPPDEPTGAAQEEA